MTVPDNNKDDEVVTDFYPFFRVYKDGRVHRFYELYGVVEVPPSPEDPETGVSSKDIHITPDISARLYLPKSASAGCDHQKLPILVYYHGGGLVIGSPFFETEHRYLNILVSQSNCVAISVNYRLAPEHDLPTVYQDCWTALQWVASHCNNKDNDNNLPNIIPQVGSNVAPGAKGVALLPPGANTKNTSIQKEPWIANHGDLSRLFIGGDSAGGNIVYNMAMRAGQESLNNEVKIFGAILCFPYLLFPSVENIEQYLSYKLWNVICPPSEPGVNSPLVNPEKGTSLSELGCSRIFLCTGEKDELVPKEVGIRFAEAVKRSGWKGEIEFIEVEGEGHCFQTATPEIEKAKDVIKRMARFLQRE